MEPLYEFVIGRKNMSPIWGTIDDQSEAGGVEEAPARRRSRYLTATALARSAAFLALPLALAPPGASAATITIDNTCALTGAVCNATSKLPAPSAGDTIAFTGGALTMNSSTTYPDAVTLTAQGVGNVTQAQFNNQNVQQQQGIVGNAVSSAANTINQAGNANTFSGVIADAAGNAGAITITNVNPTNGSALTAGSVTFSKAETYTGSTVIKSGATLLVTGSIAKSSGVTNDGTLNLSNGTPTITSLSGSVAAASVLLGNNQTLTITNASGTYAGKISGGNQQTKLQINGGIESLMGSVSIGGTTTVGTGATLTGTGSVTGPVSNSGTVRPFDTVSNKTGTFTISGDYTQTSTGILNIAIGGTSASGLYSKLAVGGAATLAGGLDIDTVNGFSFPNPTDTYSILTDSSVSGDFASLFYNGSSCTLITKDVYHCGRGLNFTIANTNGLTTLSFAPEPGTLAILASGLLGLAGLRCRRDRRRAAKAETM
jgi:autotransporter-associated beta strand protein